MPNFKHTELNRERKGATVNGISFNSKESQGVRSAVQELSHVTEGIANLEVLLGNLLEDRSLLAGHNPLAELL